MLVEMQPSSSTSKFPTSEDKSVKIFAKVSYPQHYYNTGCLDEESLGMDRVAEHGS